MKVFLTRSKLFFARDPPFEPKPSLKLVCDFLVSQCARPCPQEMCPVCQRKALPEEPQVIFTMILFANIIFLPETDVNTSKLKSSS